jgi:hypothetical protein
MTSYTFADAVSRAIGAEPSGTFVPCLRPYSGIRLLQLIEIGTIKRSWRSLFKPAYSVLVNPGIGFDNLIAFTDDADIRNELFGIVDQATVTHIAPLTLEQLYSVKEGLAGSIPLADYSLASVGLKNISNKNWTLSLGDGIVFKAAVSERRLNNILRRSEATRDLPPIEGVVTAIYFIKGGLQFRADDVRAVAIDGVALAPTNKPVSLGALWQYEVKTPGKVSVAETNPREWIIAIDYLKVESTKTLQKYIPNDPAVIAQMPGNPEVEGSDVENTENALLSTSQKNYLSLI